ncbi:MAG: leucine-rich repeat domain-containing protein, partial [Prevotellaceae bacterium]|nr:leucine-rich repeat domain-containing protein [Prevotellaceae bacterium]
MKQTCRKTTMMLAAGVLLGIGASAQTTTAASGTCGADLTWVLTSDSTLTISGAGAMENYDSYALFAPGAFYASHITSGVIEEGVTSIGGSAFYGCSGLPSVSIPSTVTSIGIAAFLGCSGLTAVT